MTYKTRQEVLRAAADWMDVCEAADVPARCKISGIAMPMHDGFVFSPDCYEFPLALLEGKEVWVGSELYLADGHKFNAMDHMKFFDGCSWNPPKPKTVTVEMLVEDAKSVCKFDELIHMTLCGTPTERLAEACKKALDNLK